MVSRGQALLFTFGSVALWALLLVTSRILLVRLEVDPWSFTFIQLVAGGILLIALSTGGDSTDWSSLRRPGTWIYGVLRVVTAGAFTAALIHATVTYAGLLGTINVVFGVAGASVVYKRRPSSRELWGHVVIMAGIAALIFGRLDGGVRNPAVLLMFISEVAVVASTLVAETHPDNNSHNPKVRLRFTGTVLLVTALLFLAVRVLQDGIQVQAGGDDVGLTGALWASGLVVGLVLRGPVMHSSLKAIRLVGAEVYLMMAASLPFIGLVFETVAGSLGLIERANYTAADVALVGAIAGGAVWVISARTAHRQTPTPE